MIASPGLNVVICNLDNLARSSCCRDEFECELKAMQVRYGNDEFIAALSYWMFINNHLLIKAGFVRG
ncbi:hypothetical protein LAH30_004727 [Salmonella enterica]|nr:hypothetical protein [Salmonella enterica]EBE2360313.1 hypothetical protein [Salmonella enterica]EIC6302125.1 hypothetical protein [Salmonella enterica]EIS6198760.1 hypothetical protein [Salmonella enterica]EJL4849747.1 hypothetical protein [Salmonella enterica]